MDKHDIRSLKVPLTTLKPLIIPSHLITPLITFIFS